MLNFEKIAKTIILEIEAVIPYHINIMDCGGKIIASSDTSRLYQIHQGAQYLISHQLSQLRIDERNEQGQPGMNFPIYMRGNLVGVLGITGDYDKIIPYANIIRKMTEIMLENELLITRQQTQEKQKEMFIYEWIHMNEEITQDFYKKGLLLGIDISEGYRIAVIQSEKSIEKIMILLKESSLSTNSFFLSLSDCCVCVIRKCNDDRIKEFFNIILEKFGVERYPIYVGIDLYRTNEVSLYKKYQEAYSAVLNAKLFHEPMKFYCDLTIGILLEKIDKVTKQCFLERIFQNCETQDINSMLDILECYYRNNRSIQKASKELFMHKNTLQNRLQRITEKTGHNPHNMQEAVLFQLAIWIVKSEDMVYGT